jgi:phosphocarrier protein
MVSFSRTVKDEHGIHARPAGVLVNCAKKFSSEITVKKGEKESNAKRLLSVMGLGAKHGETLEFIIDGNDEKEAAEEIIQALADILE